MRPCVRPVRAPIAFEAARQCHCRRRGRIPGDKLRFWLRREAVEIGLALGRHQLDHLEAIGPVGNIGEQGCIGGADDHVARIVELATGGIHLIDARPFGALDIDEHSVRKVDSERFERLILQPMKYVSWSHDSSSIAGKHSTMAKAAAKKARNAETGSDIRLDGLNQPISHAAIPDDANCRVEAGRYGLVRIAAANSDEARLACL